MEITGELQRKRFSAEVDAVEPNALTQRGKKEQTIRVARPWTPQRGVRK